MMLHDIRERFGMPMAIHMQNLQFPDADLFSFMWRQGPCSVLTRR